jgi:hypothetical protein
MCVSLFSRSTIKPATASRPIFLSIVLQLLLAMGVPVQAHPVSLSSAMVDVHEGYLDVELQIMLEDLVLYHGLKANGQQVYSAEDLLSASQKHRQFVTDYFTIRDAEGQRLGSKIETEAFEQIEADGVPQSELMQRSIGFVLRFELPREKPEYLTFFQEFGGPKSALPAIMDLYVLRKGQFEESAQIAFGKPHTVRFDWQRQTTGRPETAAELRKRRKEQFQERLGISSYSGLYSFLYINRFEVRHEILIPILTLKQWLPIEHADSELITVEEQEALRPAIASFFELNGRLLVGDQEIQPRVEKISIFSLDINDFALGADPRPVNLFQGRVGVIVRYPCQQSPGRVSFTWDKFSDAAPFIDAVLLIGNQAPDRFYFHSDEKTFQWQGELIETRIGSIREDLSLDQREQRVEILAGLLSNIYHAFDYREDEQVYDTLAKCVSGDLLREVYLRMKRSLLLAEQGGDLSHATKVEVTAAEPDKGSGGALEATWQLTSVSEHWGHIHTQTNQYKALLTLQKDGAAWKLQAFQLLDEKRIQFQTSIRGYDKN